MDYIRIKNATEHNLKNVSIDIPKNKLVAFTGVSGSGKTTMAYDIVFAEAQREYLDSLSTYSRISMPRFSKAKVESIEGLSPAVMINQEQLAKNPRSTVGTVTEIYTYLRLLFSRFGKPILNAADFSFNTPSGACEKCKGTGEEIGLSINRIIDVNKSLNEGAVKHRTWKVGGRLWNIINASNLFDMDKPVKFFSEEELNELLYSESKHFSNDSQGFIQNFSYEGIVPRILKRHNDSRGLESVSYDAKFFKTCKCSACGGSRVNEKARSVLYHGKSIVELSNMEIQDLLPFFEKIDQPLSEEIISYIVKNLKLLVTLGIGYLTLSRSVSTLSNGESQRIKLARQLGNSLSGLMYVLDEPTAGLHEKDKKRIVEALKLLTQKGNTVLVVEHDKAVISNADFIIDMGPKAGAQGGEIVYSGNYRNLLQNNSLTGMYFSNRMQIRKNNGYRSWDNAINLFADRNNLKDLNVKIPLNVMTCITGVSGSGKSSLMAALVDQAERVTVIDQSPVGASPRSNPATYTKAFDEIRKVFAESAQLSPALFAFNSTGACEKCKGLGYETINMHFLGDVKRICEECKGKRYKAETLQYKYRGKTIADVLNMTIDEAKEFFDNREIVKRLDLLSNVGLGYLQLGQSMDTLSGGEVQRVKLASGLSKSGEIYVLDEPTRGLHIADVDMLVTVMDELVNQGNTLVVVEHNLEIIKNSDWIVDLGPEGGEKGGYIVAEGTPEEIMKCSKSYTGKYLAVMDE